MRQKRGRHCPRECKSIVAFAKRQPSSQQYGQAGGRLLFLIHPTQCERLVRIARGWAVEGQALNVIQARLCDGSIEG